MIRRGRRSRPRQIARRRSGRAVLSGINARGASYAGWVYLLIGPVLTVHGFMRGARRRKLETHATVAPDSDAAQAG